MLWVFSFRGLMWPGRLFSWPSFPAENLQHSSAGKTREIPRLSALFILIYSVICFAEKSPNKYFFNPSTTLSGSDVGVERKAVRCAATPPRVIITSLVATFSCRVTDEKRAAVFTLFWSIHPFILLSHLLFFFSRLIRLSDWITVLARI